MTKREIFIEELDEALTEERISLSEDALIFYESLRCGGGKGKTAFTDNGKLILQFMEDNVDNFNNLFKAKEIGEGIGITSRTASGAMRKLVSDGYVEKMGTSPSVYALTDKGKEASFSE
jgi:DNA-binding MarR family transcriptional regulator